MKSVQPLPDGRRSYGRLRRYGFFDRRPLRGIRYGRRDYNDLPEFRFLKIGGYAPTSQSAVDSGTSITVPFLGEFRYCQLKSPRGIYNDCSQTPAEMIVDYHSCVSDHATMRFTRN